MTLLQWIACKIFEDHDAIEIGSEWRPTNAGFQRWWIHKKCVDCGKDWWYPTALVGRRKRK